MKRFEKTFADFTKENFSEYTVNTFNTLKNHNKEYKQIIERQKKLRKDFPMIEALIFNYNVERITTLSKKDVFALRDYLDLIFLAQYYENYEIFLIGQREEYFSLKSKGIIK